MNKNRVSNLTLSAMFLALGQVLPFITGQIPQIGSMLLPMHFPVFLCAFICGSRYGAIVGFICPLLRSVLFEIPVMYPTAIAMAFELMGYGLVTGIIYKLFKKKNLISIYISLIMGMLVGRIIWGIVQTILLSVSGNEAFTFQMFIARGFTNAMIGIVVQLIIIPLIINAINTNKSI